MLRYFYIADIGQVDVPVLLIVPLLYWSVLEAFIIVISGPMVISSLQRVVHEIKVFGDEAKNLVNSWKAKQKAAHSILLSWNDISDLVKGLKAQAV